MVIRAMNFHWEIKGRFRKRVVLANVPSFRFSFWGNIRMYPRSGFRSEGTSECTLVPVFVPGEHPPKPPFWKPSFCQPQNGLQVNLISNAPTLFLGRHEPISGTSRRGPCPRIFEACISNLARAFLWLSITCFFEIVQKHPVKQASIQRKFL